MKISPLAGKPAPPELLVDVPRLVTAYYTDAPDPRCRTQRVRSAPRGIAARPSTRLSTNGMSSPSAGHLPVPHAAGHRRPAVSRHRHACAVGAGVRQRARGAGGQRRGGHDRARGTNTRRRRPSRTRSSPTTAAASTGLADGIVITPSHNPPDDGGFKYNPPNGGPADTDVTGWIEAKANALLEQRPPGREADALRAGAARRHDAPARLSQRLRRAISAT